MSEEKGRCALTIHLQAKEKRETTPGKEDSLFSSLERRNYAFERNALFFLGKKIRKEMKLALKKGRFRTLDSFPIFDNKEKKEKGPKGNPLLATTFSTREGRKERKRSIFHLLVRRGGVQGGRAQEILMACEVLSPFPFPLFLFQ